MSAKRAVMTVTDPPRLCEGAHRSPDRAHDRTRRTVLHTPGASENHIIGPDAIKRDDADGKARSQTAMALSISNRFTIRNRPVQPIAQVLAKKLSLVGDGQGFRVSRRDHLRALAMDFQIKVNLGGMTIR